MQNIEFSNQILMNLELMILKSNEKSNKVYLKITETHLFILEKNYPLKKFGLKNLQILFEKYSIILQKYDINLYSFNSDKIKMLYNILSKKCIIQNNVKDFYIFYNLICKTNFSKIFFVNDKKFNLDYVFKVIDYNKGNLKELKILKTVNSSNIIKLNKTFFHNNKIYLLFDFYKNINDFNLLRKNKKYPILCLRVIKGICNGLLELKNKNIFHRDLSIKNILFKRIDKNMTELDVLISDFGISKIINQNTKRIKVKGTKYFTDPKLIEISKQILNKKLRNDLFSLDIFSLGSILFYLITQNFFIPNKIKHNNKLIFDSLKKYKMKNNLIFKFIDLIDSMTVDNIEKRIDINGLLHHSLFEIIYDYN